MTYTFTKIYDANQTTWQQNLDKALNGTLVCFGETGFNILDAGVLVRENKGDASFSVTIGGVTYYTDRECKILSSNPAGQHTNDYLWLVTANITQTTSNVITRGGGDTATISSSNPRDQFAMEILNAIIQKQNNPEMFDDAAMLRFTQVAYRWANTMMEIAADSRYNDSQAEQQAGNTSNGELQAIASALNTVTVKGNSTYTPSGGTAIPDVLNVNVVAGGGGSGGSVNLDDLIKGLGYDKNATAAASNVTQAAKMDELVAAVTNSGQLKKANVAELTSSPIQAAYNSLDYFLVYSEFNGIYPYKLSRSNFDRLYGLLPSSQTTFPAAPEYGYYYKVSTAVGSSLTINLGSYTFLVGAVRIFIARFTVGSSACALSFTVNGDTPAAGAVKWRGTKLTSLDADTEYEMDFVANGSCWTVGATKIVS